MNPEPNTTTANETSNANPGRTANGRFSKGNRGGPGNPFARQTARLRQAAVDAVSPEDIKTVIDGLKKKAAQGDVPASKLLFSYCIGKEDPDTLDQHELKTIVNNHLDSAAGPLNVLKGMPLDVLVEMFELILPVLRSEKVKLAKTVLCAPLTEEEIEAKEAYEDEAVQACEPDQARPSDKPDQPEFDPFANTPEWMQNIGKETEQPAAAAASTPKPARQRTAGPKPAQPSAARRPSEAEVDAKLLHALLERARNLQGANPPAAPSAQPGEPAPAASDASFDLLTRSHGRKPPSANGVNGKK